MANLLLDDSGRPKPQVENSAGTGFEAWKGENNAGRITGDIDHDAIDAGKPVKVGGKAADPAALPADVAAGDRVNALFDLKGRLFTRMDIAPPLPTGAATEVKQDAIIGYINALETLLTAIKDTDGVKKITDPVRLAYENLTILTSQARTVSGTSAEFTVGNYKEASFFLNVTAVSGTAPTLDVVIQTKDPVSGEWFDIVTFTQATGVTKERKADKTIDIGSVIRASYTIGGTDPSFTFSLGAVVK